MYYDHGRTIIHVFVCISNLDTHKTVFLFSFVYVLGVTQLCNYLYLK